MARYIEADALIEELKSLSITVTGLISGKGYLSQIVKEYKDSILRIIDEQPTADVVPRREVDNWYQLYHSIKEELKQEKMYNRETNNLCDRYCIESQQAKRQVAREIFEEIEKKISSMKYNAKTTRKTVKIEELKEQVDWVLHEVVPQTIAELQKKYTEGENEDQRESN